MKCLGALVEIANPEILVCLAQGPQDQIVPLAITPPILAFPLLATRAMNLEFAVEINQLGNLQ